MRYWVCLVGALVASCATKVPPPTPNLNTQRVEVRVLVKCMPNLGPEPMFVTDPEFMMARDILDVIRLYKADRKARIGRSAEKDAALKECTGGP